MLKDSQYVHQTNHIHITGAYQQLISLKGTHSVVVIWVKNLQTEIMARIYSKSPVRAISKVLLVKFR